MGDPLQAHAEYTLLHSETCKKSWFLLVRNLCAQYDLPHPLTLLYTAPDRKKMKKLIRLKITEYWQTLLAAEAQQMSSLKYIDPTRHSVVSPHYLWTAAGSNPQEINKSVILARMMSGRYRTERLCRFWSENKNGYCLLDSCHQVLGDLEHLLLHCPGLQGTRNNLEKMWFEKTAVLPPMQAYVVQVLASPEDLRMNFILDCTAVPEIITLYQTYGIAVLDLALYLTRTYVYVLHRKKLILTGKWPYAVKNPDFPYHNVSKTNISVAGPNVMPHLSGPVVYCGVQPVVHSLALPEDPPGGVCGAGQFITSNIASITSTYPCHGNRHDSHTVNGMRVNAEVQGHSEHVHTVSGATFCGVSGLGSGGEGYDTANFPSGTESIQQSSAVVRPWPACCVGESGSHGCTG